MISASLYPTGPTAWEPVRESILGIERASFGDKSFPEILFIEYFSDSRTVVVLLCEDEGIIGFTFAAPVSKYIAHIWDTVILPEFQGKGLVALLMQELEAELVRRGFTTLQRDAATANGYADKIERTYRDRIIEKHDQDSEWGPQRFFKIKLS